MESPGAGWRRAAGPQRRTDGGLPATRSATLKPGASEFVLRQHFFVQNPMNRTDLTEKSLKAEFSHFTLVPPGRRCSGAASPFERLLQTTRLSRFRVRNRVKVSVSHAWRSSICLAHRPFDRCSLVVSVSLLCPLDRRAAQIESRHKTVLVLHTYGSQSAFRPLFDRALQQTLNHNGFEDAEVYMETLESNRFPGSKHAALFQYYLGQKYAGRKIDLVITVWDPALNYALEHREELFPNAPILAVVTRPRTFASDAQHRAGHGGRSFPRHRQARAETSPRTRAGLPSSTDRSKATTMSRRRLRDQLGQLSPQVGVEYWRNLPLANLIERVKALPDNSVILYVRQTVKTRTQPITQSESLGTGPRSGTSTRLRRR